MADTTPTLREAAQRLLNAIEAVHEAEKSEGHARGGFVRTAPTRAHQRRVAEAWHENAAAVQALRAALAEQAAEQAEPVALDVTLTEEETSFLRDTMGADEGEAPDAIRLTVGNGHSGYGLYVSLAEYGNEGSSLLKALAAPPAPARQEPLDITYADGCEPNAQLTELADRIDNEMLWSTPLFERDSLSQEQRDRLNAGVALRRYAHLLGQNRWSIFSPNGSYSFSADTLERVIELALRRQERAARAHGITAAPAEGGAE